MLGLYVSGGSGSLQLPVVAIASQVGQSSAPPVLWDVGVDVVRYPKYFSHERAAAVEASEIAFWESVMYGEHEQTDDLSIPQDAVIEGDYVVAGTVLDGSPVAKPPLAEVIDLDVCGASGSVPVTCSQVRESPKTTRNNVGIVIGGHPRGPTVNMGAGLKGLQMVTAYIEIYFYSVRIKHLITCG